MIKEYRKPIMNAYWEKYLKSLPKNKLQGKRSTKRNNVSLYFPSIASNQLKSNQKRSQERSKSMAIYDQLYSPSKPNFTQNFIIYIEKLKIYANLKKFPVKLHSNRSWSENEVPIIHLYFYRIK